MGKTGSAASGFTRRRKRPPGGGRRRSRREAGEAWACGQRGGPLQRPQLRPGWLATLEWGRAWLGRCGRRAAGHCHRRLVPGRRPAAGAGVRRSKDSETSERARFPDLPKRLSDGMEEKLMRVTNSAGESAADTLKGSWGRVVPSTAEARSARRGFRKAWASELGWTPRPALGGSAGLPLERGDAGLASAGLTVGGFPVASSSSTSVLPPALCEGVCSSCE